MEYPAGQPEQHAEHHGSRKLAKLGEILGLVKEIQGILIVEVDEFDMYGEHVASQMRNIKDKKTVAQVRRKIEDVLFSALMGEYLI